MIKALLLLTIYMLSTAGGACIALSCRCVHVNPHETHEHCAASHCCGHDHGVRTLLDDSNAAQSARMCSECCRHNHSVDIELYTADADEKMPVRVVVAQTYVAAVGDESVAGLQPARGVLFADCVQRFPLDFSRRSLSLRAPPVCA